ncbi:MAG: hypothetical protein WC490_05055 [Candidatus Margulisiibacteriota bacterium]
MTEGRGLFPVSDYGYGKWLRHPGARIFAPNMGQPRNLVLSSGIPRQIENSRYVAGWDCVESSFWLMNRLKADGFSARCIGVSTPLYPQDVIVLSTTGSGIKPLSLTPGVEASVISMKVDIPDDQIRQMYGLHRFIDSKGAVTGVMNSTHLIEVSQGFLKCAFGIYFDDPSALELSIMTTLAIEGRPFGKHEIVFSSKLRDLGQIQERIIKGDTCYEDMFRIKDWWPIDDCNASGLTALRLKHTRMKYIDTMESTSSLTASEYIPLIFSILDPEWAWQFSGTAAKTIAQVPTVKEIGIVDAEKAVDSIKTRIDKTVPIGTKAGFRLTLLEIKCNIEGIPTDRFVSLLREMGFSESNGIWHRE